MLDLKLPRTSRALAAYQGPRIAPKRLTTADLVFFGSGGSVSHVGIYVGEGRFVHAPSSGGTVRLDRLDGPYWRDHYSGAKRVLHCAGGGGPPPHPCLENRAGMSVNDGKEAGGDKECQEWWISGGPGSCKKKKKT